MALNVTCPVKTAIFESRFDFFDLGSELEGASSASIPEESNLSLNPECVFSVVPVVPVIGALNDQGQSGPVALNSRTAEPASSALT